MNKLNDQILNHHVLRKLIEMNLASQNEVRRLIVEEIISEATVEQVLKQVETAQTADQLIGIITNLEGNLDKAAEYVDLIRSNPDELDTAKNLVIDDLKVWPKATILLASQRSGTQQGKKPRHYLMLLKLILKTFIIQLPRVTKLKKEQSKFLSATGFVFPPTTVFWGDNDVIFPISEGQKLAKFMNADFKFVERDLDKNGEYSLHNFKLENSNWTKLLSKVKQKQRTTQTNFFQLLLREIKLAKNLELVSLLGGEPLLHNDIDKIIDVVKDKKIHITTGLGVSNNRLLNFLNEGT